MMESAEPGTLSVYFGEENDTIVIALERIFIQHTGHKILARGSHATEHKPGECSSVLSGVTTHSGSAGRTPGHCPLFIDSVTFHAQK